MERDRSAEAGEHTMHAVSSTNAPLKVIEGQGLDPLIGTIIDGRYEVERVLGEGGMGLVYRARHTVLKKPLAIKVLRPEVSRDEQVISRFKQEAQSASSIGNEHIIDISDFGVLPDGSTYFIMEYLDGTDLTKCIETASPIAPSRIVHIGKQLCDALAAAHEGGIVHRDLKPDNIYLVKRGADTDFVKVLDFGIAKVGGASSKLTRAGQVFGTPHYMSPEQCAGTGVDHRTDLYAIGIIFYEMVVGRTPFDADNLMGILTKHLFEAPIPPTQLRPDCPRELESVILRCIAKKPEERYANCRELLDDLRRIEQGMPSVSSGMTFSPTAHVPSGSNLLGSASFPRITPPLHAMTSPAPEPPPARSNKLGIIALAGTLLLVGAGAAAFATRTSATPRPLPPPRIEPLHIVLPNVNDTTQTQAAAPTVRLISEPAVAEVWSGGELVGQTPLEIPRPAGDARLEVELRAAGYATRTVTLSSHTLGSELRFTLTPERATTTVHGNGTHTNTSMEEPAMMTVEETTMTHERPDVIDPWDRH